MNKEYIRIAEKSLILTDNGLIDAPENIGKIEDFLVIENLLEKIQQKLDSEKSLLKLKEEEKESLMERAINSAILIAVIAVLGAVIFPSALVGFALCGIIYELFVVAIYKKSLIGYKGEMAGKCRVINYLEEQLENEKLHLQELQKTPVQIQRKTKLYPILFSRTEVDDKLALENLKRQLLLQYKIGVEEKKYLKFYKEGILGEKLAGECTPDEMALIEKHFEDISQSEPTVGLSSPSKLEKKYKDTIDI